MSVYAYDVTNLITFVSFTAETENNTRHFKYCRIIVQKIVMFSCLLLLSYLECLTFPHFLMRMRKQCIKMISLREWCGCGYFTYTLCMIELRTLVMWFTGQVHLWERFQEWQESSVKHGMCQLCSMSVAHVYIHNLLICSLQLKTRFVFEYFSIFHPFYKSCSVSCWTKSQNSALRFSHSLMK